jgi:hypothetical protein
MQPTGHESHDRQQTRPIVRDKGVESGPRTVGRSENTTGTESTSERVSSLGRYYYMGKSLNGDYGREIDCRFVGAKWHVGGHDAKVPQQTGTQSGVFSAFGRED